MDLFPARIAIQIDRLVLGINRQVGPRHGRVLDAIAAELGLDSLKLIPHFADFLLSGPLPVDVAEARLPYAPPGTVREGLARFAELGLVTESAASVAATDRFRPLLVASVAAREDVVRRTWTMLPTAEIEESIVRVVDAVPASYTVAAAHRDLTPPSSPALRFFDRLVTLRYVRQHDHVEAWRAAGLSAGEMQVLTALWFQETMPDRPEALAQVEARGLTEAGELTGQGRSMREQIEVDTNRRAGSAWAVLDVAEREMVIEALSQMPDTIRSDD
jgi:hypothetical protein